jgi:signal transduction histidine kinase
MAASYLGRLEQLNSPLLAQPQARSVLLAQARAALARLALELADPIIYADQLLSPADPVGTDMGLLRASQGVHPTASVQAAIVLYEVILPVISRELGAGRPGGPSTDQLATALHRSIMHLVATATGPYVAFLLRKLRASHLEERQRVARELHDHAAHSVGIGLRQLELHRIYAENDPDRAAAKLEAVETAMREALATIRTMSAALRHAVADSTLEAALRSYLRTNVPVTVTAQVTVAGDSSVIPLEIAEELYLVVREAIRNALLHAQMKELRIELTTQPSRVTATVRDDGRGFADGRVTKPRSGGLLSMTERVELLSGKLEIVSGLGAGTTVSVQVPLLEAGR